MSWGFPATSPIVLRAVVSLRRPLRLPITLAVVMLVLLAVLTVGWVLVNVFSALASTRGASIYWILLPIGTTFIALLVVGVVMYLALSIKAINLTHRQSNFVDSVTHELKSPISSLKLYLQTLNRRQLGEAEQADFHRCMLEEVERLDRLINHVLEAGRSEAGTRRAADEPVELGPLLRECADMVCLRYRVPTETVQLKLEPCTVLGRRVDLDIIFRNLLDNAVKYAGSQPRVDVNLRQQQGMAVVTIADNGRGIPPKLRRKIFGRFVRVGAELEREKPGTGLGLYIVRNYLRRMRGTIRVADRPGAAGAVFEVRLHAAPGAAPAASLESQ